MAEEVDLTTVPRDVLEKHVEQSIETMAGMEDQIARLETFIATNSKVDPDVIQGWRDWMETLDAERTKWARTATRLDQTNRALLAEQGRLLDGFQATVEKLESIREVVTDGLDKNRKTVTLRKGMENIDNLAFAAIANIERQFLVPDEPDSEPEKPEDDPQQQDVNQDEDAGDRAAT